MESVGQRNPDGSALEPWIQKRLKSLEDFKKDRLGTKPVLAVSPGR